MITYQKRSVTISLQSLSKGSGTKKKARLLSDELCIFKQNGVRLVWLICPGSAEMELAPYPPLRIGCQGFIGPLPSAFLDKCVKELVL